MKRPYWSIFVAVQLAGCIALVFIHNDFVAGAGMILLSPGFLFGPEVAGLTALVLGGWDALPTWVWFIFVPMVVLAINFASWYAITILRKKKPVS